ncbi:MAG: hypothetical protein IRY89_13800 [Pseudolabrys sp.]|nr:hypothetical protein [Pseudolabrys sp.]
MPIPIVIAMMLLVERAKGAQSFGLPQWLKLLSWLASALMALADGPLLCSTLS